MSAGPAPRVAAFVPASQSRGVTVREDGVTIVTSLATGMATLMGAVTLQVLDSISVGGIPNPVVFSTDTRRAFVGDERNSVIDVIDVIDIASRRVVTAASTDDAPPMSLVRSTDGTRLFGGTGNRSCDRARDQA